MDDFTERALEKLSAERAKLRQERDDIILKQNGLTLNERVFVSVHSFKNFKRDFQFGWTEDITVWFRSKPENSEDWTEWKEYFGTKSK